MSKNCFFSKKTNHQTRKAIWDHTGGERKGDPPGSPDDYRQTVYEIHDEKMDWKVAHSLVQRRRTKVDVKENKKDNDCDDTCDEENLLEVAQ